MRALQGEQRRADAARAAGSLGDREGPTSFGVSRLASGFQNHFRAARTLLDSSLESWVL